MKYVGGGNLRFREPSREPISQESPVRSPLKMQFADRKQLASLPVHFDLGRPLPFTGCVTVVHSDVLRALFGGKFFRRNPW